MSTRKEKLGSRSGLVCTSDIRLAIFGRFGYRIGNGKWRWQCRAVFVVAVGVDVDVSGGYSNVSTDSKGLLLSLGERISKKNIIL